MAYVAQDTFNAELPDGGQVVVQKGAILPSSHPVVKLHGKTALFAVADFGEDDEKPKRGRPRKAAADAGDGNGGDE